MRVLYFCQSVDGMDGWATYTKQLADGMRRRGHEVRICTTQAQTGDLRLPPPLQMLSRPWKALFLARSVAALCRTWKPDVLHVTVEPYALMSSFLPQNLRERMILTIHGSYGIRPLQERRTRFLALRSYRAIHRFITVSRYTKEIVTAELRRRGRDTDGETFAGRTTVIHNAVPLPAPLPPKAPKEMKIILCVGGIKPRKGILEAVKACSAYKRTYGTSFRFLAVGKLGDENYVREVRTCMAEEGLQEHVTLTGPVSHEELERLYSEADLFLMPAKTTPTTFEGFGIVFLEANSRGVPCIGPRESGAAEAIDEGVSGFRVDPTNPQKIAQRIHQILDEGAIDPSHCVAWAQEHNLDTQVREVEAVYKSLDEPSQGGA
ncbi:MAG: glycosyltransferase family 4 protein [Candidatus Peribacteraceae bacterium]|jgi:glycosyltransferase involved in cell wall biosynthesis